MPNWVHNRLLVTGDPAEVAGFVQAARDEAGEQAVLDFERHVPTPPELLAGIRGADTRPPVRTPTGDDRWFDWRREHWGTKWNAMCGSGVVLAVGLVT